MLNILLLYILAELEMFICIYFVYSKEYFSSFILNVFGVQATHKMFKSFYLKDKHTDIKHIYFVKEVLSSAYLNYQHSILTRFVNNKNFVSENCIY